MRLSHFFSAAAATLFAAGVVSSEEASSVQVEAVTDAAAEAPASATAPIAVPTEVTDAAAATVASNAGNAPTPAAGIVLGPQGIDDQGRTGRLHTVVRGDTLWHVSDAYLGTPWVWPSVWTDNEDIANPHRIVPGDKIWITANEMRVVTEAEAESFIERQTAAVDPAPAAPIFDEPEPVAAFDGADEASSLDAFPVEIAGVAPATPSAGRPITVARRDSYGFVSDEDLRGATSIVDSPSPRTFLVEGDDVYVGMGEGDVQAGDQFMIFEVVQEVRDVETNRLLGHHVENLGWLEIKRLTGDTSVAEIRQSYHEIERGSRLVARPIIPRQVAMRQTPDAVEGQLVFLPADRTIATDGEYAYVNRGEFHGIEVGTELEVFVSGRTVNERERRVDVRTPDTYIGTMVVVSVEPESCVAFVLSANRELEIGDRVRPADDRALASR